MIPRLDRLAFMPIGEMQRKDMYCHDVNCMLWYPCSTFHIMTSIKGQTVYAEQNCRTRA